VAGRVFDEPISASTLLMTFNGERNPPESGDNLHNALPVSMSKFENGMMCRIVCAFLLESR
jgi:hypothetical protein